MLLPYPWYSKREWNHTLHEKEMISSWIVENGYNTPETNKFFVMLSGDTHMLTYDNGVRNEFGHFPIF
jgi:hypothetical protein